MKKLFASAAVALTALAFGAAPVAVAADAQPSSCQTAQAAGSFNVLLAAVDAAGFDSILQGEGPLTVFAPVDEVFANLPEGTVEALLAEEGMVTLKAILGYHVVPGKVMSADIAGQALEAETAAGIMLAIDATGDSVMVGGATVVAADIETSNGVIHVIDSIMLPPAN